MLRLDGLRAAVLRGAHELRCPPGLRGGVGSTLDEKTSLAGTLTRPLGETTSPALAPH